MKVAHQFGAVSRFRYRPEFTHCLPCGAPLVYRQPVWGKVVQSLTTTRHLTNLGYRCGNPTCAFSRTVYRSAAAEREQVTGSGYGPDVVARIGYLRFHDHRTRA